MSPPNGFRRRVGTMKIRIEIDEAQQEEEVIIRCREVNEEVLQLQNTLRKAEK